MKFHRPAVIILGLFGLLAIGLVFAEIGSAAQINPTAQQQTIDAAVAQRLSLTATAAAVNGPIATNQAAADQQQRATVEAQRTESYRATQAAIEATQIEGAIQTAVAESVSATSQAQAISQIRSLLPEGYVPPGSNEEWEPVSKEFDSVPMVLVPQGCFDMGNPDGFMYETPVHNQCINEPFWIDKYEVDQRQFSDLGGIKELSNEFSGDDRPVENITWFEAAGYCSQRGGRLPTEAEWEFAARGPDNYLFPWGNEQDYDRLDMEDTGGAETHHVEQFTQGASWVGALNMAGNVFEWTASIFDTYPYPNDGSRERDTGESVERIIRGGGYSASIWNFMESTMRYPMLSELPFPDVGFRCVLSLQAAVDIGPD